MEPMQTLLDEDCVSLHRQGKEYWKSQAEVYSMVDKLCQVSRVLHTDTTVHWQHVGCCHGNHTV